MKKRPALAATLVALFLLCSGWSKPPTEPPPLPKAAAAPAASAQSARPKAPAPKPKAAAAVQEQQARKVKIFSTPPRMDLCGQRVPLELAFVAEQFDREFVIAVYDRAQVIMWLKRARRYFPYISARLKEAGMPDDLKYLAVAESSLLHRVRSPAGAVGVWQFIAPTARRYGLRVNHRFDDRRNIELATGAAMEYLKDLKERFNSWPLAMAAYNCGERRVEREVAEQGVKDYYHLYLPNETMRYVFRILAVKAVLSDPGKYGYELPAGHLYRPRPGDSAYLSLKHNLHLRDLARASGTTVRMLKELNPELRTYWLPKGAHRIKTPQGSSAGLQAKIDLLQAKPRARVSKTIGPETSGRRVWVVRKGDTLSSIAKQHGVRLKNLRRANGIKGDGIQVGQRLVIPKK